MLQGIRDRAHGYIAWIIVILICIPFALWGVQEYLGPDPNVAVAEVDGEEISLFDYQTALQGVRASLNRQFPGQDVSRMLGDSFIRTRAMDGLVRERLVARASSDAGFVVSDEQLAGAIRSVPAFRREGAFSQEEYEFALRRSGQSPGRFEASTRRRLLEAQWRDALVLSAAAAEGRARRLAALESQTRTFSRLVVPAERFAGAEIGEEAVAKRYEAQQGAFMSPEEVRLRYVVLSRDDLAVEIDVPHGTLESYYEGRKAGYTAPEQRRVRHILIADEEGGGEARARAEDLRARILGGEAFEDLAREFSDDPGSAESGGDLGFGGRGIWVPPFEQAAFSLGIGELSEPVQSDFGFHLIRVEDIRKSRTRTFDEVREEIEREYRTEQAEQLYFEQVERLSNLAFEQPDNLYDAAEQLGLTVEESAYVSRRGEPGHEVLGDPAVIAAAFGEDVLAGNNSEPVEIEGYRTVVVRVDGRREPRQRTLDEVRPQIVAVLRAERATEETRALGVELLGRLRVGEGREAVAGDLAWGEERTVGREEADLARAVREVLFSMPRPGAGAVTFDGVALPNGDFVILALDQVIDREVEAKALDESRLLLSQRLGLDAHDSFVAALRERSEIRVFEDRVAAEDEAYGR
jgi:peptidyl-prolyl cis-trans isomerase D